MKHLLLRGSRWHARMGIPKDVRAKLGHKREFTQSLRTADRRQAEILAGPLIAEWKNAIELARGSPAAIEREALAARMASKHDSSVHPDTGMTDTDYYAESIADKLDDEGKRRFYNLYTGRVGTPFDYFLEDFVIARYDNPKTAGDARLAVKRFKHHCSELEGTTRKSVIGWLESETRARKTVSKSLSFLINYWEYLQDREVVSLDVHPFRKHKIPSKLKPSKKREPFNDEEVSLIIKALKAETDQQLFLLVHLAIYTGARISELAALTTEDLIECEGVVCLNITDSKTEAGKRVVPVHRRLKKLVISLSESSGDGYLLAGVNSKGGAARRADVLGKRFGRLVRNKLSLPPSKVFHSFRNTVITKLEKAGIPENIAADLVGHEKDTVTYGLYSSGTDIKQRQSAIDKINYEGT